MKEKERNSDKPSLILDSMKPIEKKRCLVIEDNKHWRESNIPFLVGNSSIVVSSYKNFDEPQKIINAIKENNIQAVIVGGCPNLTTVDNEHRSVKFTEIKKQISNIVKTISFGSPFIINADVCISKLDHDRLSILVGS